MKELFDKILAGLDLEIDEIDLYGYDIIETSLSMIHKLQAILNDLRIKMQTYVFPTKEDEILFFKTQKPELLGRLLFFYKIYRIETQCPTGSNEIIRLYINNELGSLTYFFNRNLDFISITVHILRYMTNFIFCVGKWIFGYVQTAHNLIKTRTFQPDMIIKSQKYLPMKCCASI